MADRRSDKISGKDWRLVDGKWVRSYGASPGAAITRPYKKFIKGAKGKIKKAGDALKTRRDNRKKELIGKGTAKNPQFIINKRGRKVSNPSYTPPTKTTKTTTKVTPKVKTKVTPKVKTKVTPKVKTKVTPKVTPKVETKVNQQPKKDAWKTDAAKKWLAKHDSSKKKSIANKLKKAGFSDEERWKLQKEHRDWKAKRGR